MEGKGAKVHFHNTSVGCDHPPQPLRYLALVGRSRTWVCWGSSFQDIPLCPYIGLGGSGNLMLAL